MIDAFSRLLRQPEYIHTLLNPLPIYGLSMGLVGLLIALFLRSRRGQIATLAIILIASTSAWPVFEFGEQGYDRVLSMADEDGQAWLEAHQQRAEKLIYAFYALALISAIAIALPIKFPKLSFTLSIATFILGIIVLCIGGYIAYAGGKIRHREFRTERPPNKTTSVQGAFPKIAQRFSAWESPDPANQVPLGAEDALLPSPTTSPLM